MFGYSITQSVIVDRGKVKFENSVLTRQKLNWLKHKILINI